MSKSTKCRWLKLWYYLEFWASLQICAFNRNDSGRNCIWHKPVFKSHVHLLQFSLSNYQKNVCVSVTLWTRFFTINGKWECMYPRNMKQKTAAGNDTKNITIKGILIMSQCPFLSEGHHQFSPVLSCCTTRQVLYSKKSTDEWKCLRKYATLMHSWLILLEMINALPQRFWLVTSFFTLISFATLPLSFSSRLNLLRQKDLACAWYAGQNCHTRIQPMRRTPERQNNEDKWGEKKRDLLYIKLSAACYTRTDYIRKWYFQKLINNKTCTNIITTEVHITCIILYHCTAERLIWPVINFL